MRKTLYACDHCHNYVEPTHLYHIAIYKVVTRQGVEPLRVELCESCLHESVSDHSPLSIPFKNWNKKEPTNDS